MPRLRCPKCTEQVPFDTSGAGSVVICPKCGARLRVPSLATPEPPAEVSLTPAPRALPTFEPTPYRAPSYVPLGGLISATLVGLILAGLVGAVASAISTRYYLPVLFPIGMGVVMAVGFHMATRSVCLRSPPVAALIGLMLGLAAMLAMHQVDAWRAGVSNAFEYLDARARAGVTLSSLRGGPDTEFGYTGSWIFFGVEALMLALMTGVPSWAGGRDPFCVPCRRWKKSRDVGTFAVTPEGDRDRTRDEVRELFRQGRLDRLDRLAEPDDRSDRTVDFSVVAHVCPRCDRPIDADLMTRERGSKNDASRSLVRMTYPAEALPVLMRVCGLGTEAAAREARDIARKREEREARQRRRAKLAPLRWAMFATFMLLLMAAVGGVFYVADRLNLIRLW